MDNKVKKNMWIVAGICFLIAAIVNIVRDKSVTLIVLDFATAFLSFINVFIQNKAVKEKK